MRNRLTFSLLDDLLLAHSAGRATIAATGLRRAQLSDLGPAIEYCIQQLSNGSSLPPLSTIPLSSLSKEIIASLNGRRDSLSLQPKIVEIRPIPRDSSEIITPAWIAFQQRLKLASEAAGFASRVSAGIAGAFWEMVDNAMIHGEASETRLAGYQWDEKTIAYCVADDGIGVLESLKKCHDYTSLEDYGSALRTAVQDGASRFGHQTGRGLGFSQVLKSLAGIGGTLRFRSGDFSLELDGTNLTFIEATLSQRSYLKGFVVSVTCRTA